MKKIICMLVISMTAIVCINARVCGSTGCYSNSQRGGFNHDRTCRVVDGYSYCTDYSGIYLQLNPGMAISPNMGFVGSFAVGRKFHSGMTLGLRLEGSYTGKTALSAAMTTTYEFTALRKYTDIFYPVLGLNFGFGGMQVDNSQRWDLLPYVGCRAGFRFAAVRGRFDIGVEYSGNYNFAIQNLADHSENFFASSVAVALCVYIPN